MKLRCDGRKPCGSCHKRKMACKNSPAGRPRHPKHAESTHHESTSSKQRTFPVPGVTVVNPKCMRRHHQTADRSSFCSTGLQIVFKRLLNIPHREKVHVAWVHHDRVDMDEVLTTGFRNIASPVLMSSHPLPILPGILWQKINDRLILTGEVEQYILAK